MSKYTSQCQCQGLYSIFCPDSSEDETAFLEIGIVHINLNLRYTRQLKASSPESLQLNLTAGSHMWVTPSQLFSSLRSMQSVSPSQRQRMGMQRPSIRHWNSSTWQPPGGRVAAETNSVTVSNKEDGVRC